MPHGSSGLKRLFRELAKFGAVGGAGVLVNLGVFNLVRHLTDLQVVRASVIATVVSIVFNYVGFRYFTYRDRDKSGRTKELTLFLLFSMVGLVIENGLLFAATYGFGWDSPLQSNVFKFVGIGIATLFRFWSYRTWVFRALPAKEAVADAESFLAAAEQTRPRPPEPQAPATAPGTAPAPAAASATAAQRMR
ncbi:MULTISPECIES: GtrA family protein [Streptomyces]|jgi:putative flippase GtrA|uniref:GtrA family protein n=1 Tax=Streptomyces sp. 900129855 TaxID=3155129 RepID=A0ABV2ZQQ1_9ACTN